VTLLELERLIPDAVLDDVLPSPILTRNETIITHACRNPGNAIVRWAIAQNRLAFAKVAMPGTRARHAVSARYRAGARLGAMLTLVRLRLPRELEFALRAARADLPETAQYRLPARIRAQRSRRAG
jgi:hypothetical protein